VGGVSTAVAVPPGESATRSSGNGASQRAVGSASVNPLRAVCTAVATSVVTIGFVSGWTPLSSFLMVLPLVAVALARRQDFSARWRVWLTMLWLLAAAAVPTLVSLPLANAYGAMPVWWSTLLRGWGFAGLVGLALVIGWRCWPVGTTAWRMIPGLLLQGALLIAAPPLGTLYVQQFSSDDFPNIIALSQREDLTLRMADGTHLDARWYLPRSGKPRGVVVFTHGFSGWKEAFLNHLRLFLEDDWAVLTYDMRGHGRSSPSVVSYGARESDDLVEVWREARRRADGLPLATYGVSLGSAVTLLAAERLQGCRLIVVESPFADAGAMMRERLPALVLPVALAVARNGAGFDPMALVPLHARLPERDTQLVVSWIRTDAVIPAAASRAVAKAFPQVATFEMPNGAHLDLIVHQPYRDFLHRYFTDLK